MFEVKKVMGPHRQKQGGQAVVEFALILIILLMIIFVVIESARIFQANLTVQNAARDAGRYAITGEFDPSCLADTPPCDDPRLVSVKNHALQALSGLRLDPNATFNDANYYLVEVFSPDGEGNWVPDTLGGPGDPVLVRVTYRVGIITPILNSIARTVQVRGQVVYNNEESRQTSLTSGANPGSDDAPNLPPLPTTGPTPTATPVPPVLAIEKAASDSEVNLGEPIEYTIVVGNQGGGPATNVVLTDNLPGQVSFDSASPECNQVGGVVECDLGELGPGDNATVTIGVNTQSVGTAINTAEVTSDEVDPVDDSASTVITDPTTADLDISKTAPSLQMTAGETFDYTIDVRNLGPADANNIVVTDVLDDGLTYVNATTTLGACNLNGSTVTCEYAGPLAANGAHMIITLTVEAVDVGQISNTATVVADETDPDNSNNSSTAVISVDPAADLLIEKSVEPDTIGVREFMTYTLAITNLGPEPATNVTVIDDLPAGVGIVSISPSQGWCEQQPDTDAEILCGLGTLAVDDVVVVEIVAIPTIADEHVTNTADVYANELDPQPGNNTASVSIFIEPRADLSITKTASESRVHVDDVLIYTLEVTNSDDSWTDAPNVVVTDPFDGTRLNVESAVPTQGSCTTTQNDLVDCKLGTLAIGQTVTIDITVDLLRQGDEGDGGGDLFNSAGVEYGNGSGTIYEDQDPSNNSDEITIYVGPGDEAISIAPICGDPGETVVVSGTGWTTSGPQNVTITFDPGGTFETVFDPVSVEPDADGTWTVNPSITISDGLVAPDDWGFYTILAQGRIDEEAEAQFEFPCPAPDLTPTSLTLVSPPAVATESTEFEVVIENVGRVDAGAFTVALYFDPDPPPAEGDTQIESGQVATQQVNGLAVGESTTVRIEVAEGFPDHGQHTAWVLIDSNDAIVEELETNNIIGDEYLVLARPVAEDDAYSTDEDVVLTVPASEGVLANDSDADADDSALTAELIQGPSDGTLSLSADGSFTYTPDQDFNGSDSFTYEACDTDGLCSTATVSLTVNPINDAPVANDDAVTTDEDVSANIDVLANDTDVDGDTLTVSAVTQPANGTVTNNGDSVTYDPDPDFNGTDTFEYTVDDGNGATDTATVTVTIDAVNDPPVAEDDNYETNEDTTLTVDAPGVLDNDEDVDDPLAISGHTSTSNGTLTFNQADGSFVYEPDADFCGEDTFTYTLDDGAATDTATVTIDVICANDAPVAEDDTYETNEDTTLNVAASGVLANDSDVDDELFISENTNPSSGQLTLNADGSFEYVPDADYCGTDSFTYTLDDGAATDTATVTITVHCVNDAPVARDDFYETSEETSLSIAPSGVLANDEDVDDPLNISGHTTTTSGTLTFNEADGSFEYVPNDDYCGGDTFTYTLDDGSATDTATVTITVHCVNDAPVANDDSYSTQEDQSLTVNAEESVLANDTDVDGDTLTATKLTDPPNGTLTFNSDGSFSYTPNDDFNGSDSFDYEVCDPDGLCDSATVTISVGSVNDAPVAADDTYGTQEDQSLTVNAEEGVLANDTDVDGDALTATKLTDPSNGTLQLNSDGSFIYTPDANFNGSDTFTYEACDSASACDSATVTITVNSVNDAPVANDDTVTTNEDTAETIDVLANDTDADGDELTITITSQPTNGTLTANADGTFDYTPDGNYCGPDEFTYSVDDGNGGSDSATVTIDVTCVNDPPQAVEDSYDTVEDTPLNVAAPGVLGNDEDVEGDTLTATLDSGPTNGSVTLNGDGSFEYTPNDDFCGDDTFTYTVGDGSDTDTGTVTITVECVNDAPVAVDDTVDVDEDTPTTIDVAANDEDVDGNLDLASTAVVSGPSNGSLVNNGDGTFEYTPDANYNGDDSFTYEICDTGEDGVPDTSDDLCDTATVSITVLAVNDAPVAEDDSYTVDEDTTLNVDAPGVLDNDTDVEGDTLAVASYAQPANGSVTVNADGSFSYTPDPDFCTDDTFTYTVEDGNGGSDTGTVTISVTCINDSPDAMDDVATVNKNTPRQINVTANDEDVDVGDVLTVITVSDPANGSVTIIDASTVEYTPATDYIGSDSFTYTIDDGNGATDTATVDVSVIEPQ